MTTTLTPTEQQAVKEAAFRNCSCPESTCSHNTSFMRGVSHALSTLFEPRCVAFAEWVHKHAYLNKSSVNQWYYGGDRYTTSELYSIYNEQLNKQQDGSNDNS